jgi:Glycosyl hydrolases family 16
MNASCRIAVILAALAAAACLDPRAAAADCALPVSGGVCPSAPPIAPAPGKRWTIAFDEEFSGNELDRTRLTPCFDWNTGSCTQSFNHGRERYEPGQVVISNGTAKLIAEPLKPPFPSDACQGGMCTYKAGLLSTARPLLGAPRYLFTFTYGYVEARFKFPSTRGFFTAFWMLPADPSFKYRNEIDILEVLGSLPTMFMTYHYAGRDQSFHLNAGKFDNGACPVRDYSAEFVTMGLDWQPDHIAWYIDGHECGSFTDASQIADGPMQIILHLMVDNDWQRKWNLGLQDPTLVRQLEVDYIRVFQQAAGK